MIKAEMIAASQHAITGRKIATMKIVMPRYILAEFNTHRLFSRNSASSRAIPAKKMITSVMENPFIPIAWQKNHSGMQGTEYFTDEEFGQESKMKYVDAFDKQWRLCLQNNVIDSQVLNQLGLTKQLSNRLLEPFMYHTVLVTATEYDNFFELRCPQYEYEFDYTKGIIKGVFKSIKSLSDHLHWESESWRSHKLDEENTRIDNLSTLERLQMNKGQADIHMMALAEAMYDTYQEAFKFGKYKVLQPGEWHIPYADQINAEELIAAYEKEYGSVLHTGNLYHFLLKRISIARCARLSYQTLGDDPKIDYISDIKLFDILSKNGHLSPFEHVAQAMTEWESEIFVKTIIVDDKPVRQSGWCANFRDFKQYRSLIENQS